jgi:hypothetical protein
MAAYIDINPYPLGAVKVPTPGTPVALLTNVPELLQKKCNVLVVQALPSNGGSCYVGRQNMSKTTFVGVVTIVSPGETKSIPYDIGGLNQINLAAFYADADVAGEGLLCSALFA